jgi:hypothetical protein
MSRLSRQQRRKAERRWLELPAPMRGILFEQYKIRTSGHVWPVRAAGHFRVWRKMGLSRLEAIIAAVKLATRKVEEPR